MATVDELMAYEAGEMEDDDTVAMFQKLINNGMAWTLQGSYGRMATFLIDAGLCHAAKPSAKQTTKQTTKQTERRAKAMVKR